MKILTDEVDFGKVVFDGFIGVIMGGICTGSASNMTPLVSGYQGGIKFVTTQISKEVMTFYYLGAIESSLALDLGYTAVTVFGAWYGSGLYDVMIGWCE